MSGSDPALMGAFIAAVQHYKPWHNHTRWHSTGNDAFAHIITGAFDTGVISREYLVDRFGVTDDCVDKWAAGQDYPGRKTRIAVWKTIKEALQIK